jgi:hypothetical protein
MAYTAATPQAAIDLAAESGQVWNYADYYTGMGLSADKAADLAMQSAAQGWSEQTAEAIAAEALAAQSGNAAGEAAGGSSTGQTLAGVGAVISGTANAYNAYNNAQEAKKMRKQAEKEYDQWLKDREKARINLEESAKYA